MKEKIIKVFFAIITIIVVAYLYINQLNMFERVNVIESQKNVTNIIMIDSMVSHNLSIKILTQDSIIRELNKKSNELDKKVQKLKAKIVYLGADSLHLPEL